MCPSGSLLFVFLHNHRAFVSVASFEALSEVLSGKLPMEGWLEKKLFTALSE